jgi:hypothetical protein
MMLTSKQRRPERKSTPDNGAATLRQIENHSGLLDPLLQESVIVPTLDNVGIVSRGFGEGMVVRCIQWNARTHWARFRANNYI